GIGASESDEHVKRGGLSCTVGTQQTYDLALAYLQIEVVNNLAPPVGLVEVDRLEFQHKTSFLDPMERQTTQSVCRIDKNFIIRKKQGQLAASHRVSRRVTNNRRTAGKDEFSIGSRIVGAVGIAAAVRLLHQNLAKCCSSCKLHGGWIVCPEAGRRW